MTLMKALQYVYTLTLRGFALFCTTVCQVSESCFCGLVTKNELHRLIMLFFEELLYW